MTSKVFWAAALALGIAAGASAQEDAVVKAIRAKWDPAAQAIKDMTMTATMDGQTPDGPMKVDMTIKRKGLKVRTEMNMNGFDMVSIFDGKDHWMVTPMGVQKAPANQRGPGQAMQDTLPADARVTGSEKAGGRDCHVVEYKEAGSGKPVKVWVDKKSLTPVKSEMIDGKKTNLITFSDHRKVTGDYEVPYKTEMQENGKLMGTVVIKTVAVNSGLADDEFVPKAPAGGMQMPMMPKR
jgi:outer membrane lipoprotein-sorting protein